MPEGGISLSIPGIRAVESRADLKRFIKYPFATYRDDPHGVPPRLIAERGGEVVGRAAIDDDNHNRTHDEDLIFFGFFEAKDETVAEKLLTHVEDWGRRLGRSAVRGPANPSMNDGAGLQINAFDTDPYVMMPYNPPVYPSYVETAGYQKDIR